MQMQEDQNRVKWLKDGEDKLQDWFLQMPSDERSAEQLRLTVVSVGLEQQCSAKKMVESYWGTWDAQPAPVPVQGRIEGTICPVDPQLSSEDLTSRNILSQMPFPVSKRSEGRAVLYSLGIDLQLCGAADKIWRGMEPPQHWEITLKQEQQQGHHRTWLGYQTAW